MRWIVRRPAGIPRGLSSFGALPVRVTTTIGIKNFGQAVFPCAQYDAQGVLLIRKTIRPSIGG